jgi:hypothetical protein
MEFHGDCPLVIEHNYGQAPFLVAENRWGLPLPGKRFQKEVDFPWGKPMKMIHHHH